MWHAADTPQWPTTWSATSPATLPGTISAPCARPAAARDCPGRPRWPWRVWRAARRGNNGAARRAGGDSWWGRPGAARVATPTTPSFSFSFQPRCLTPLAMSGTWVMGVLVPSALISMWCLMWCCFGAARQPPVSQPVANKVYRRQSTFKYNPVTTETESPRANLARPPTPGPPPSPPAVSNPAPRTLPGLHFIHSTAING